MEGKNVRKWNVMLTNPIVIHLSGRSNDFLRLGNNPATGQSSNSFPLCCRQSGWCATDFKLLVRNVLNYLFPECLASYSTLELVFLATS